MAELAFRVRADYEEALLMTRALHKLRDEMMKTNDSSEEGKKRMADLKKAYDQIYKSLKTLAEQASVNAKVMRENGNVIPEVVLKQGLLQKSSLALGKALVRMGLSAQAARAALSAIGTGGISLAVTAVTAGLGLLIKKYRETKQAAEDAKKEQEEFYASIAKGAAPAIGKFEEMRRKWMSLSDEMSKQRFLKENQKELKKLGVVIDDINTAESLFVEHTQDYWNAQISRARADLYRAQVDEKIAEQVRLEETAKQTKTVKRYVNGHLKEISVPTAAAYEAMRKLPGVISEREALQGKYDVEYGKYSTFLKGFTTIDENDDDDVKKLIEEREKLIAKYGDAIRNAIKANEEAITDEQIAQIQNQTERVLAEMDNSMRKELEKAAEMQDNIIALKNSGANTSALESENLAYIQSIYAKYGVKKSNYLNGVVDSMSKKGFREALNDQEDDLDELLSRYGSYEEKRVQIHLKWLGKIEAADEEHKKIYEQLFKNELFDLEAKEGGGLSFVFGNVARYTKEQLAQAKRIALDFKKKNPGLTPEALKELQEAIDGIEEAEISKEFEAGNDNLLALVENMEYLNKLENQWIDAVAEGNIEEEQRLKILLDQTKERTNLDKWAVGASMFSKALGEAAGFVKEIADISGRGDLNGVSDMLGSFQAAFDGFASGGPMGAFVGYFTNVLSNTFRKMEEEIKAGEKVKNRIDNIKESVRQLRIEEELREDGGGIFGNDARKRIDSIAAAMKDIRASMGARDMDKFLVDPVTKIGGRISQLASTIGVSLYDKYGNLNANSLKEILDTYEHLDKESRKWIEDAINDSENYEKAIESLKKELNSVFGNMSSQLAEMTINGLKSGAEIGSYEMKRILGGTVVDLQRQMVEGIYARYLSQYEDDAFKILQGDDENKEESLVNLYATMIDNMSETVAIASNAAQHFEDVARERGFEMDELTNENGSIGSYQNISETTGSAIDGRLAALQIGQAEMIQRTFEGVNLARDIRNIQADSYLALIAIRNNTGDNLTAVREIRDIVTNIEIKTRNL